MYKYYYYRSQAKTLERYLKRWHQFCIVGSLRVCSPNRRPLQIMDRGRQCGGWRSLLRWGWVRRCPRHRCRTKPHSPMPNPRLGCFHAWCMVWRQHFCCLGPTVLRDHLMPTPNVFQHLCRRISFYTTIFQRGFHVLLCLIHMQWIDPPGGS
jgi:hypothetical protein